MDSTTYTPAPFAVWSPPAQASNNAGPYLGQVASRTRLNDSFYAANKQSMSRTLHVWNDSVSAVRVVFAGFYGEEVAPGATSTITASIEYPAGTFAQLTFYGSPTGTIPNGGLLVSDALPISAKAGTPFFVRAYVTNTAGLIYNLSGCKQGGANVDGFEFGPSGITDKTMGGTVGYSQPSSGLSYYTAAIIGMTTKPSVFYAGDSRAHGYLDLPNTASSAFSYLERALPGVAILNGAVPGSRLALALAAYTQRTILAGYCSHVISEYGINDLNNSRTAAQVQTDRASLAALFGNKPVFGETLIPYTSSTDNWATLANQSVMGWETQRTTLNDAIRAGITGEIGYIDIADIVETARNSGKWITNGTANYYTPDGIHPNAAMNIVIARSGIIPAALFAR